MKINKLRSLNLLIKPSSCNCNLRCNYCFYFDVAENRETYTYGNMSFETLENLVKNVYDCVEYQVNFIFQGGEPTMRGINYYYKLHELIEKYNKNNVNTTFSIQTNGTLLNKRWFDLFEKYNYLIGISLDGTKDIHDIFRIDIRQKGTFDSILNNINKLRERNIDFNILCVVNSEVSKNAKKIYEFFREQKFEFLQFIPALDPLKNYDEKDYTLTAENYGKFLDEIFNLWYEDLKKGNFISIRYFENLLLILSGRNPEVCDMVGHCSVNTVIEADGSVYPCDFYVVDERRLGNINTQSIPEIIFSQKATEFVRESFKIDEKCKTCKYLKICRTGCKRHKDENNVNKFCYSYKYFFGRNLDKLVDIRNRFIK
ncbi:anaerobic sulfatase maturase [Streptobacillus moniliformis]|uniref:anaerobic sulfatase maturase n=1 Tax=Streptobacillus moniliformis TaxID=34105 RepID=UPI0007E3DA45|nr:anaerobic sulfatase maturase [Streptobacillus moniliformis]